MRHKLIFAVIAVTLGFLPAAARAGVPGRWDRISPANEQNIDEANAVRSSDGTLHAVFRQSNAAHAADDDLVQVPIAANGTVGSPTFVAQDWAGLTNPAIILDPVGLRTIFGGIHTPNTSDPNQDLNTGTSSDGGSTWTVPPVAIARGGYDYASDQAAAVGPGGVPFEAWGSTTGLFVHRGLDPASPNNDFQAQLGGCCGYDPGLALDAGTGQLWVAWYSNATNHPGVFAQQVDGGSGGPVGGAVLMPGSVTVFNGSPNSSQQLQRTPIAGRPGQAGAFVAYPGGYPSQTKVLLWRIGTTTSTVLAQGSDIRAVSVASDPVGRLWVTWTATSNGTTQVFARRSNAAVTAFGAAVSVAPPAGTVSVFRVDPFAQTGAVDLIGNFGSSGNSDALWHTQVRPGMTVTVTPAKVHRTKSTKVTAVVQDAGAPLAGALVTIGSKHATTNSAGTAKLKIGKAHHKVTVTVTDPSYTTQTLTLGLKH